VQPSRAPYGERVPPMRKLSGTIVAMGGRGLNRRELLAAGAAAGAVLGLPGAARAQTASWSTVLAFTALNDGDGWPGWTCAGVANLRRSGGRGLLEAGSDVFPCDPRPVAFAVDRAFVDGEVAATVASAGAGTGVVVRRTGPRAYYAAVYDAEQSALVLLRRSPDGVDELGRTAVPPPVGDVRVSLAAAGQSPTRLTATFGSGPLALRVTASDATPALQQAGDPGVLATARTLYPSQGPPFLPALGNVHLLPYGVQEGEEVMASPVGETVLNTIHERSTAVLRQIELRADDAPQATAPSVVAAGSGLPLPGGASLRVAADVPADVQIEVARTPSFRNSRIVAAGPTNAFGGALADVAGLPPGRRAYWRARLTRAGRTTVGPARSFPVLPRAGSAKPVRLAIAACASQFGPIFGHLREQDPDVFVWQGDLNYPDTVGPLAQTNSGYAGIWRDFLANPVLAPLLERSLFAVQRDDHDYGVQDANSTNLVPWGIAPWEALMEHRGYYRFAAGAAEVWVLDQRRNKSDPTAPDSTDKTLLGAAQRAWLLQTLAASRARFKVVCSPCTLAPLSANARDGSWAAGFTAERDLVLQHIRDHVTGQTIFVSGDTHWTMVYDRDGLFEARPCPLGIPTPNDITLTDPNAAENARSTPGVQYADDEKGHFALLDIAGDGVDLSLVREDGAVAFRRRFA
jgi:hypothetical protein